MAKIISIHSFLRGVGKSNLVANLAALLAAEGRRVGVVDTDLESPALHLLFGLGAEATPLSLNDYLRGECAIEQTVREVAPYLEMELKGRVFVVPASGDVAVIARGLGEGYNINLLQDGILKLIEAFHLDALLVDTHAGLSQATLAAAALSDVAAVVLHLDRQGYQGTGVWVEVARRLNAPRLTLIVNQVTAHFDLAEVKMRIEQTYRCQVTAVLPRADDMLALASAGLFVLRYPGHLLTTLLKQTAVGLTRWSHAH